MGVLVGSAVEPCPRPLQVPAHRSRFPEEHCATSSALPSSHNTRQDRKENDTDKNLHHSHRSHCRRGGRNHGAGTIGKLHPALAQPPGGARVCSRFLALVHLPAQHPDRRGLCHMVWHGNRPHHGGRVDCPPAETGCSGSSRSGAHRDWCRGHQSLLQNRQPLRLLALRWDLLAFRQTILLVGNLIKNISKGPSCCGDDRNRANFQTPPVNIRRSSVRRRHGRQGSSVCGFTTDLLRRFPLPVCTVTRQA